MKIYAVVLMCSLYVSGTIFAAEYHVDTERENIVKFISDAPIEDFEGVTSDIDGFVLWSGEDLLAVKATDSTELYFEVHLETLDTGIGLRNRHMRDNYLETKDYPYATYAGSILRANSTDSNWISIDLTGEFTVHGEPRMMELSVAALPEGDGYRVKSEFEVKLSDHGIDIPKLMFLKIDERMQLELDFYLKKAPK